MSKNNSNTTQINAYQKSLGSLTLEVREAHTHETLRRTASIENCAPEGVHKLIHAIAKAAFDGNPVGMGEVKSHYDKSVKGSKNFMHNLGRLTAQPFPMVTSKAETGVGTGKYRNVPLYDVSTGNTIAERYANVGLSQLGRLLTRHYKDEPMDFSDHYKSIVPLTLLRKTTPFSLGHRTDMYPLNPKEMFKIQVKMMEKNSPFIDGKDLQEIFKGFDLGDDYKIYMTQKALTTLYTKGESSFIAVPKIVIRPDIGEIQIKAPPLSRTSKALRNYLNNKGLGKDGLEPFKTFTYHADVDLIGKEIRIKTTSINTDNLDDILKEIESDSFIRERVYTRNETARYIDKSELYDIDGKKRDNVHDLVAIAIDVTDKTPEQLRQMTPEQVLQEVKKHPDFESLHITKGQKEVYNEAIKSNKIELEYVEGVGFEEPVTNPYSFEIDISPIYETLWQAIQWEKEQQIKTIQKKLKALEEQLKLDLLLEKVTRPEVADVVYRLQPDKERKRKLAEQTRKGSKLLPEGFLPWEIELIYQYKGNNYLALIWEREKFAHQYEDTLRKIKELKALLEDDPAIMKIIKDDLQEFINDPRYDRKTEVYFLREENPYEIETIPVQDDWDEYDLPTTLYFNRNQLRRGYGVNIYFKDFKPIWELNTTNESRVQLLFNENGKIDPILHKVKEISKDLTTRLPDNFIGIIPVVHGEERNRVMMFTNRNRYYIYEGYILRKDLELFEGEYVIGWTYLDDKEPIIDFRTAKGLASIKHEEIKQYKGQIMMFPQALGYTFDVRTKPTDDNTAWLWFRSEKNPNAIRRDHMEFSVKMLKSSKAQPINITQEIATQTFSPKINLYHSGYFVFNWPRFGMSAIQKYKPNKRPYLEEDTYLEGEPGAEDYAQKVFKELARRFDNKNKASVSQVSTIAYYTESYLNFKPEEHQDIPAVRRTNKAQKANSIAINSAVTSATISASNWKKAHIPSEEDKLKVPIENIDDI